MRRALERATHRSPRVDDCGERERGELELFAGRAVSSTE